MVGNTSVSAFTNEDFFEMSIETPDEMFHRVAANIASAEAQFGGDVETTEEQFDEAIDTLDFPRNRQR